MKLLITYKSEGGTTKQYCEWLHQEFPESDLVSVDELDLSNLSQYDVIVVGSWTHSGEIGAIEFLEKNWNVLKEKKVYLMVTGIFPEKSMVSKMSFGKIPEEIRKGLAGYSKLPGRAPSKDMKPLEKFMLKLFGGKSDQEISKENLNPIINSLKKYVTIS